MARGFPTFYRAKRLIASVADHILKLALFHPVNERVPAAFLLHFVIVPSAEINQLRIPLFAELCWIVGIGDLENIHYSRVSSAPMNL